MKTDPKRCPKCGETKPRTEFYNNPNGRSRYCCKPCWTAQVTLSRQKKPAHFQQYRRNYYRLNRNKILTYLQKWRTAHPDYQKNRRRALKKKS